MNTNGVDAKMKKIIFVGDIHGCFDDFMNLLNEAGYSPKDLIIATGDLVDRGDRPKEVIEFFIKNGNALSVMGNHEYKHIKGLYSSNQLSTISMMGDFYEKAVEFMKTLPYYIETEKFTIFHAATIPWMKISEVYSKYPQILTGVGSSKKTYILRKFFPDGNWWKYYKGEKIIIFGHNSVHKNGKNVYKISENLYNLDGGCANKGELVSLVYPDMEIVTVKCTCDTSKVKKRYVNIYKRKVFHFSGWREIERAIKDEDYPTWFKEKLKRFLQDSITCSERLNAINRKLYYKRFPPLKFAQICVDKLKNFPSYFENLEEWIFESSDETAML